ncbi:P-type H+-ATPase [Angomonas deanei]|nr:P-type H+-ATPase [Angomonas deanei]CAD2221814.1 hypothetical protein, conserved [Angomonas deanei]|eukprot:EPY39911.1 P-type H+-ATPase [Angomonas deanei]
MLITLLNDGCLLTIGYDRTVASVRPQRWNLPVLFISACTLSAVACGASLFLLWCALEGWSEEYYEDSVFHKLGLPQLNQGKIITMLYLQVSVSNFLTLFSSRTGSKFFFMMAPGLVLLVGATISLFVSTMVASFWRASSPGGIFTYGLAYGDKRSDRLWPLWIWIYCVSCWFVQDVIKVLLHLFLKKVDAFGYVSAAAATSSAAENHTVKRNEPDEPNAEEV